ncbi:MAG: acyl-CoA dehydrogenase, partial [Betaproteobacteria bacterium]|nr:acyl-CoA dehydrogenase [Betaproteobacteria bacterium]
RAWLAHVGAGRPEGPICLVTAHSGDGGAIHCPSASSARTADSALVLYEGEVRLLPIHSAQAAPCAFELDLALEWSPSVWSAAPAIVQIPNIKLLQALSLSAQMAGALRAVFERTLVWANEREQFGRPIGKFQAIQHQLAVLAEEAFAAQIAVQIACLPAATSLGASGHNASGPEADTHSRLAVDGMRIAIAKARTSEAALQGAQIAHAIHGAIGFTREFDLQLFTRRLHAWRQAAGSESAWHKIVGESLLAPPGKPLSLDFIRAATDPLAP